MLHGRVAWEYIQQFFQAANISCGFKEYIASVSESAQMEFNILTNLNYRRLIRKILMYPYVTYPMFESFDNIDRTEIISRANKFKSNLSIKKIDGRYMPHWWDLMILCGNWKLTNFCTCE